MTESYVAALRSQWKLDELPVAGDGCKLCHASDVGGVGTINQKFGRTLVDEYDLTGLGLVSRLRSALDGVREDAVDSDADGRSDYDELVGGTNPSVFNAPPVVPEPTGEAGASGQAGAPGAAGASGAPLPEEDPCTVIVELPVLERGCSVGHAPSSTGMGLLGIALCWLALSRRRSRSRDR